MRGNHHNSHEVSVLITEVNKMDPKELNKLHGITIDPKTKTVYDEVSGQIYANVLEWANSIYEDETNCSSEKIGRDWLFDDEY